MAAPLSDALSDTEVKIGNGEGWKSGKRDVGSVGLKILKQVGFLKLPGAINHPTHGVISRI